jgi:hypothetical protein
MEKDDRRNGPILTKVESTQIFGNIEEIYHLHLTIAEQLDRAFNEDASIGSVFLANVSFYITIHYAYEKTFEHRSGTIITKKTIDISCNSYIEIDMLLSLSEQQCHGSYVTEREKDDPSWDSKHTSSAIRSDVLSQLD